MINLIPPEARARIVTEYWFRVITVWLFMSAVVGTAIAALLLPAYVLVTSQVEVYKTSAEAAALRVTEQDNAATILKNTTAQATLIVSGGAEQSLLEIFDIVEAEIDAGSVLINEYSFTRNAHVLGEVRVEGVAATRLALASFRDALIKQPLIEKVDLPISNLAKDKDIQFSFTLVISTTTPSI